ncbi:MAG: GIY-YIG nuclease family protein [Boseongicola sp.]|nr:GIY-YIG nuclease family protein [Boseongicola sp.]
MRDQILEEIRRLAVANGGATPGQRWFEKETGIKQHQWRGKYWARWGDAVEEAGLPRNFANPKLDPDAVLDCLAEACRLYGRFPTDAQWKMHVRGKPDLPGVNAYRQAFGGREGAVVALRKRSVERGEQDLIEILEPDIERIEVADAADSPDSGNFARLKPRPHFVYLAKSANQGRYKIGHAKDAEARIVGQRTTDPSLDLIHKIETRDPVGVERYWQDLFQEQRLDREWFDLNKGHVDYFRKFNRQ